MKHVVCSLISSLIWVLGFAQSTSTYSYIIEKPQNLVDVLADLEGRMDCSFSYPTRILEQKEVQPQQLQASSLQQLLDQLFYDLGIEYKLLNENEILLRKTLYYRQAPPDLKYLITGAIIDQQSNLPLSDVAVYLDTLQIGMMTDEDGKFAFEIPLNLKNRSLKFQRIGYRLLSQPIAEVRPQQTVKLVQEAMDLGPVTVTEELPTLQNQSEVLATRLNTKQLGNNASGLAGQDLFRNIQLLPGVNAHNDTEASIKIRGSSGDETLLMLDGIPIYKAEHFFGVFSSINSSYVSSATLYKNALPVSYGGKTGGMLLMESEQGTPQRFTSQLDLNLLTSSVLINTPLSNKVSFLFCGRTSYEDAANNPIFDAFENDLNSTTEASTSGFTRPDLIETVPSFNFYDLNAKLNYNISKASQIDLNFYRSNDDLLNEYQNTFQLQAEPRLRATNEELFENNENWENLGASANFRSQISDKWALNSSVFYTQYKNTGNISSSLTREIRGREVELWGFENSQYNEIEDFGVRVQLDQKKEWKRSFSLGAEFIQHDNQFLLLEEEDETFDGDIQGYEISAFGAYPIVNNEQFHLDLGARITHYSPTQQFYFSPRLNMWYQASPTFSLKASASRANQFVREITHENRLGQSLDFFFMSRGGRYPVGTSDNFMLGATARVGDFSFDLEAYHKSFTGVIEHARVFTGFDRSETNPGRKRSYQTFNGQGTTIGLDFLVQYQKGNYNAWLAYTLSKTENQFKEIYRNEPFPSEDDRRHQLSFVNNYRVGSWSFSANFVYASGRPFGNLANLETPQDRREIQVNEFFSRLPSYQRIDLGAQYYFNIKWTELALGISMFNVANTANVKYQQFIYALNYTRPDSMNDPKTLSKVIGTSTRMLDRTLNLSLKLKF